MTSFTTGFVVGDREFCIFSMTPLSEITTYHTSTIREEMGLLCDSIHRDPESLKNVFAIHRRLFEKFQPAVYLELEKPMHVGISYIVNIIRAANVPVSVYSREE